MNPQSKNLGERLRALPAFTPPSGGWTELQRKLEQARQRRRQRTALFALAASVTLTLGTLATLPMWRTSAPTPSVPTAAPSEISGLMAQSRALESNLQQTREHVGVWDAASAARAAALQRDLTIVDLQLSYASPPSAQRLWRDRVSLLSDLVRTHQEAGLVNASYVARAENKL